MYGHDAPRQLNGSRRQHGDVVIIGAGLAGLFTALKLAPMPVTVITAAPLGEGASSVWAQGGIAAAVGAGDTAGAHMRDTIAAGAGIVDDTIARLTASEAPERIRDLRRFGVPFDRDREGRFRLSREAAHSAKRILRVSGDRAGLAIMQALITSVRETPTIRILEGFEARALMKGDDGVDGLILKRNFGGGKGRLYRIRAAGVVLATGGIGHLFKTTTNPAYARGDALAMAAKAGAVIADAEFVQFHPTAIDAGIDPAPLATEALRGEGAVLINASGKRFMADLHERAELAPRDVVARAVFREIKGGRGAFLDCRGAVGARFPQDFPTVYGLCQAAGIDPVVQLIPVAPAVHYHMGGIASDEHGRTSIDGLWACGEVASTGLHGANRLASNSLLEAVVFGARVAADIDGHVKGAKRDAPGLIAADVEVPLAADERDRLVTVLRETMQAGAGVERDACGLEDAIETCRATETAAGADMELANMALAARFIATAALRRKESRGGHFRADFPQRRPDLAKRSFMTLSNSGEVIAADVPAIVPLTPSVPSSKVMG